ncbi:Transcription factor TGA like domain [Macleaya cordata]|uniref:Transcription factor TGA like domain n=1 Tax=Macleaya cordata TaxID=56857 RepID=A0A200QTF5_MACCD|nr:Transcription factor TGA like domain [Macleaya cordata]
MAPIRFSSPIQLKLFEKQEEDHNQKEDNQQEQDDQIAEPVKCISLYKRDSTSKRLSGSSSTGVGQWRQEQRLRASRMELHLAQKWSLEELIQEQLSRFDYAHYSISQSSCNRGRRLLMIKDIAQVLMPQYRLPLEMATLSWLGNWRPSSILSLLNSLSLSSSSSSSSRSQQVLNQLIRETRIEESIIDEEMGEIQATCILHLPFIISPPLQVLTSLSSSSSSSNSGTTFATGTDLGSVRFEFKKIDRVITRAQKLRYKTLELVVKKLLNRSQAAEFLVAFAGIQEMVHEFAIYRQKNKGPISVTTKAFAMQR